MTRCGFALRAIVLALLIHGNGCAYFNTLYNARQKYEEAVEIKRKADPERPKITTREEELYKEAFERAARVVKYWPESDWVDDALLLMGKASFEKGDYTTALRKFDEILTIFPDSDLRQEAMLDKGRTLFATKDLAEAVTTLRAAEALGGTRWRADVLHHLGLVKAYEGDVEGALQAFSEVVHKHQGSEWSGRSGLEAGRIETERGQLDAAVGYYDRVRKHSLTAEERFLGGMRKGDTLLQMKELARARQTFAEVAKQSVNEKRRGEALLAEAGTVLASGDAKQAEALYRDIITLYPRKEAAAEARFALGEMRDKEGDLALARTEYEGVKEEGTSHDAWRRASARATEIQRVMELEEAVAVGGADRDKHRFLLAEHLLEQIGDTDGALAEYSRLGEEAKETEWGAKALFAKAWVLEHRLGQHEAAESTLFRLANSYSGTSVDAVARRRLAFPVWNVETIEAPRIAYVRGSGEAKELADAVLERVTPKSSPLPEGVAEAKVWVRVGLSRDGSVEETKVVKSASEGLDQASLEAARASRFVSPNDGGPEISVLQYVFTTAGVHFGEDGDRPRSQMRQSSPLQTPADSSATPPSPDETEPATSIRNLRLDGNN